MTGDTYINGVCTILTSNVTANPPLPAIQLSQNHTGNLIEIYDNNISDITINRLGNIGIGTTLPRSTLDASATLRGIRVPHGNSSQRPTPTSNIKHQLRYNNQYNIPELANTYAWSAPQHTTLGYPVTNMILDWDAANTLSYPGSGTTVNSIANSPNIQGTLTNVTYASSSFVFNGTNSYIEGTLNNPQGAWAHTISFWMQLNADQSTLSGYIDPFQIGNVNTFSSYSALDIYNGGFNWYFYNNDTNYVGNVFIANTWYHIVLTYNGGNANATNKKCFINNVEFQLEGTSTYPLDLEANAVLSVGRDRVRLRAAFPGKIARFQVFNGVLTPTEIASLYYTINKSLQLPVWYLPGMVIQKVVKRVFSVPQIYVSGANNFDTGIYVDITPRYANSLIRITLETSMSYSTGSWNATLSLRRNGTEITTGGYRLSYEATALTNWYYPAVRTYTDIPSTTIPLSYRVYVNSGTIYVVHPNSTYHIVAEEVAQ